MAKAMKKVASAVEAQVVRRLEASPERVFDAWLDPDLVRRWMRAALTEFGLSGDLERVEIDARVGGRFTFSDMREGGEAVHCGTYLEIDRPRKLVFTWLTAGQSCNQRTSTKAGKENDSVVTLTIEPDGEGCLATIVHSMGGEWTDFVKQTEKGWSTMLRQIDKLLANTGE